MRYIDPTLKAKLLEAHQTLYNNAEPNVEAIVSRPTTPITSKNYWEETIVTEDVTSICTSVAIQKTGRYPEKAYVAYVDDSNVLVVKSADFEYPVTRMVWEVEETINNCICCALAFDGDFVKSDPNEVEFRTDETPWLFYVNAAGQLLGGVLGGSYDSIVGVNVTNADAVRGFKSQYGDINQGMLVFYIISGTLYYKDYLDGAWGSQTAIALAPANAVRVHAERTFDWRIVLQVEDSAGNLHEIFTKMEISGWIDHGSVSVVSVGAFVATLTEVTYSDYQQNPAVDGMAVTLDQVGITAWNMSLDAPVLMRAENLPIEMDDYDYEGYTYQDWGYLVKFTFDQYLYNAELFPNDFKLIDDDGTIWAGQEVTRTRRDVYVLFNNFNNAVNPITARAVAGNLTNGYVALEETDVQFTAQNLVPYFTEPPVPVGVENIEDWSGSL